MAFHWRSLIAGLLQQIFKIILPVLEWATIKLNDNAQVEQKNFTHIRELFGYERYDREELTIIMNEIYKNYFNILANFFVPQ